MIPILKIQLRTDVSSDEMSQGVWRQEADGVPISRLLGMMPPFRDKQRALAHFSPSPAFFPAPKRFVFFPCCLPAVALVVLNSAVEATAEARGDDMATCPICRERFQDESQVILSCSHVFHRA